MNIEWNSVTWYSKLLAVVVFVVALFVAFCLGIQYEQTRAVAVKEQVTLEETELPTPDEARLTDIKRLQVALELYFLDNEEKYPIVPSEITIGDSNNTCLSSSGFGSTCGDITYWSPLPTNPTPGGADYKYKSVDGENYTLTFTLDNPTELLPAGPHTAVPEGIN